MIAARSCLLIIIAGTLALLVAPATCISAADGTTAADQHAKPLHKFLPVEDKARNELGMVKQGEIYVQYTQK